MTVFTQRHYEEIARILRVHSSGSQRETLCDAFEYVFKKDNPRFSTVIWKKACKEED